MTKANDFLASIILLRVGIGIVYKSVVELELFCTAYASNLCYVSFLKLVYQNKNELPGTCMAFHDDSFQV